MSDYTPPNLDHSDFDDIRADIVNGWWVRESCGPNAVAEGWWWASSLMVRDGYLRLFLTREDGRAWAAEHDPHTEAYRPDPWPGTRRPQADVDYKP